MKKLAHDLGPWAKDLDVKTEYRKWGKGEEGQRLLLRALVFVDLTKKTNQYALPTDLHPSQTTPLPNQLFTSNGQPS